MNKVHTLNQVEQGQSIKLEAISDQVRANLIRLGVCVGDFVKCMANIPGGPVVISKGLQEIAIGENYAKEIQVTYSKK